MKKNCLYERGLGWVQYDEETYVKLRKERLRFRMRMRRQDRCFCSGEERWQCDCMCDGCPFQKTAEVSIDSTIKGTDGLTLGDVLTDGINQESFCVEKMYCEDVLKRLDEIMPMARKIGILRLEGKSDREIARSLGIDRMTMLRMLERAKAVLRQEFEEN